HVYINSTFVLDAGGVRGVHMLYGQERRDRMSRIKGQNSDPGMKLRRPVHGAGCCYRLHGRLPVKPDSVGPGWSKVICMHRSFGHRHDNCPLARLPKSRLDFWKPKLEANTLRDQRNCQRLEKLGWDVLVIWECQMKNLEDVARIVTAFLNGDDRKT